MSIRKKLYDYKKKQNDGLWNEILKDTDLYFESRKNLKAVADERKEKRENEPSAVWLKRSEITFWIGFSATLISLVIWIYFQYSNKTSNITLLNQNLIIEKVTPQLQ